MSRLVILAVCLALAGCAAPKLNADQATTLIRAFHEAGCGGRVDIDLGAGTGQLGGEGHANVNLHGECPVGDFPPSSTKE